MITENVDLSNPSKYEEETFKEYLKIGVTQDMLKVLDGNPAYTCIETYYQSRQSEMNISFSSLDELFDELKNNEDFVPVRVTIGVDVKSFSCFACDGSGYSQLGKLFSDTFYDYKQPHSKINTEGVKTKSGKLVTSVYGWGSNLDFDELDLKALLESERIPSSVKTLDDFFEHLKSSPIGIDAINRHILVKNRALRYEEDINCPHCKGEGASCQDLTDNPYKVHVWVTDTSNGNCGGFEASNISSDDINRIVNFRNEINNKREFLFKSFVNDGLEMDQSLFNWDGSMFNDSFFEYDNFDEMTDDFGFTPDEWNEFANFYINIEEDALYIWVLHPRKGKSVAVKCNNLKEDLSNYQKFINKMF